MQFSLCPLSFEELPGFNDLIHLSIVANGLPLETLQGFSNIPVEFVSALALLSSLPLSS
jgi:hypothetical protein